MKTVIEMARSVGARPQQNKNCDVEYLMDSEAIERLVELVRADEREACAKECDEWIKNGSALAEDIATAIRARSNT